MEFITWECFACILLTAIALAAVCLFICLFVCLFLFINCSPSTNQHNLVCGTLLTSLVGIMVLYIFPKPMGPLARIWDKDLLDCRACSSYFLPDKNQKLPFLTWIKLLKRKRFNLPPALTSRMYWPDAKITDLRPAVQCKLWAHGTNPPPTRPPILP